MKCLHLSHHGVEYPLFTPNDPCDFGYIQPDQNLFVHQISGEITLKIFRTILYGCLSLVLMSIAALYFDLNTSTNSLSGEGDLMLLFFIFVIVLPVLGICFLFFAIPKPQKWLPWISMVSLIWEERIVYPSGFPLPWQFIQVFRWTAFVLAIILTCIVIYSLVRNVRQSDNKP